ncbi:preprotein translocase subunit SecG [Ochrovirga pacifica]|uniref:preprotein translocase subunit SecG n=1 Tax=Ochrovirga pacifica TaxID=1042376 RepID=UPI000255A532|nr:preprotein translocase subunit SecG [Ochrovirga pacifica]
MTTFDLLLILIMVVAVLLILIVLVQNPKGGGLSSSIAGGTGNTIGGVQSTNNFLDKATWTLAITLLALILLSSLAIPRTGTSQSDLQETIQQREQAPAATQEVEDIEDLINNPTETKESSEE